LTHIFESTGLFPRRYIPTVWSHAAWIVAYYANVLDTTRLTPNVTQHSARSFALEDQKRLVKELKESKERATPLACLRRHVMPTSLSRSSLSAVSLLDRHRGYIWHLVYWPELVVHSPTARYIQLSRKMPICVRVLQFRLAQCPFPNIFPSCTKEVEIGSSVRQGLMAQYSHAEAHTHADMEIPSLAHGEEVGTQSGRLLWVRVSRPSRQK